MVFPKVSFHLAVLLCLTNLFAGQYAAVLEEEVRDFKDCFKKLGCKTIPKFTVVIAGKVRPMSLSKLPGNH
jgi:hypothetical protein